MFWYVLQAVPVCLFEMAPARLRGVLDIGFQCFTTSGILAANLINYGTNKIQGGSVTPSTSVQPYVCMFFTCAIFFSFISGFDILFTMQFGWVFFICNCMISDWKFQTADLRNCFKGFIWKQYLVSWLIFGAQTSFNNFILRVSQVLKVQICSPMLLSTVVVLIEDCMNS